VTHDPFDISRIERNSVRLNSKCGGGRSVLFLSFYSGPMERDKHGVPPNWRGNANANRVFFSPHTKHRGRCVFAGDYFCVDIEKQKRLSHLGDVRPLFSLMTNTNSHRKCVYAAVCSAVTRRVLCDVWPDTDSLRAYICNLVFISRIFSSQLNWIFETKRLSGECCVLCQI
jgi:hypothetical protein